MATPSTAFILCGALGYEVRAIIKKYGWLVKVAGITPTVHITPHQIPNQVAQSIHRLRDKYPHLLVIFGDCGTYGALDDLLETLQVPRIRAIHCYQLFGDHTFDRLMAEEPGTYFLTDFMVRTFFSTIIKSMGIDQYPDLKSEYFRHYQRVVYLRQEPTDQLLDKAQRIADYLELPLCVHPTGYEQLETELVAFMQRIS